MRWSQADVDGARHRIAGGQKISVPRSKLGNVKVEWQGQKFDSKKELRDFQAFEQQRVMGAIRSVVRQVSMPLPGSTRRIRIDFVVMEKSGRLRWYDSKGFDTATGKLKRDLILQAYGIDVEII